MTALPLLLVLGVLLVLSAFFSGVETAVTSVDRGLVRGRAKDGGRRLRIIVHMKRHMPLFLAVVLVGNNVVNSSFAVLSDWLISRHVPTVLEGVATTVMVTPIVLLCGEFLPKSLGRAYANQLALRLAWPLVVVRWALAPLVWAFMHLAQGIAWLAGRPTPEHYGRVSREDLKLAAEVATEQGLLARSTGRMLHSVFDLEGRRVGDLMTPLARATTVSEDMPVEAFLEFAAGRAHTCFPVCAGAPDQVVGMLDLRDVLYAACRDLRRTPEPGERAATVRQWVRRDVPETSADRTVADLLHGLRYEQAPLIIVRDHPGGRIAGVLPVADLADVLLRAGTAGPP